MNDNTTGFLEAFSISLSAWLLCLVLPSVAIGQQEEVIQGGEIEYHQHCAVCHGEKGRGDGVMARDLAVKPADLTLLAAQNGGTFPFWRVYRTIDGRELVRGHGSREMPIWGRRFEEEAHEAGQLQETLIKGRILGLVFYLQSIQREPDKSGVR
jgi:mono/diheme cytochrome c family protein